jgi:hypothetical protein
VTLQICAETLVITNAQSAPFRTVTPLALLRRVAPPLRFDSLHKHPPLSNV